MYRSCWKKEYRCTKKYTARIFYMKKYMKDTYKVIIYFFFPSLLFPFSYLLSLRSRSILKEKQRTKST